MLGFLCDYWKLKVQLNFNENERKLLSFFIKAISVSNEAKANMVKEMKLFEKELFFYSVIKRQIEVPDLKPWSASLIAVLKEAMVFEDLNSIKYISKNKFERLDELHTLQALSTLARFHASSIIFEERKSKILRKRYRLNDDFKNFLDKGGYDISNPWFIQCMTGALEAVEKFSEYTKNVELRSKIRKRWLGVWQSALNLSDSFIDSRCVICHRDLWNNNMLFHYKEELGNKLVPDDCLLVDFQAVRYQEPAGDVILLLYCNLDPIYRENNLKLFLDYYYQELKRILISYKINITDILSMDTFLKSAEKQRLWGLIVSACLTPQFWLADTVTTETFCNTENFNRILSQNKGAFIVKMMETNEEYRKTIMSIFDEIVERYCLQ
ncbi:uncharacterized protein [Battus philenor]|uniref:uncharacterized protein n=1 Tax=Battus philenor TaxID=42288 RepID=UPI0035CFA4A8